jgi:hypothetical protein
VSVQRGFVLAWALGLIGLAAGLLGAGGVVAGVLLTAAGGLLIGAGVQAIRGRDRPSGLTRFHGVVMIFIACCWMVLGGAVWANGW